LQGNRQGEPLIFRGTTQISKGPLLLAIGGHHTLLLVLDP